MAVKKIGLLGGSFDPVHLAHIALALTAYRSLSLDQVQLIPAANPWQRAPLSASPAQRTALLNLAIKDLPCLRINTIEVERGGQTYTIDTINQLPKTAQYFWILGADQLSNFCTWHRWEDIAAQVSLVVAQRPGTDIVAPIPLQNRLNTLNRSLIRLPFEPMAVSASDIRERLAAQLPVNDLLDVAVAQYIEQHKLYQIPL